MPDHSAVDQLAALFRRTPVVPMSEIERAIHGRSRRSLFRDLVSLGYVSSYSHTGRYYTLAPLAEFDSAGLWRYQGIGFSREGTLKTTVRHLVATSDAGRTQHELQVRLGVRVHNPLLALVEADELGREPIESEYVYVAAERTRASVQLEKRRALMAVTALPAATTPALEVEVLLDLIHGARLPPPDAATLAARLQARGIRAHVSEVAAVLARHGLAVKKTARSRSRRSPR